MNDCKLGLLSRFLYATIATCTTLGYMHLNGILTQSCSIQKRTSFQMSGKYSKCFTLWYELFGCKDVIFRKVNKSFTKWVFLTGSLVQAHLHTINGILGMPGHKVKINHTTVHHTCRIICPKYLCHQAGSVGRASGFRPWGPGFESCLCQLFQEWHWAVTPAVASPYQGVKLGQI